MSARPVTGEVVRMWEVRVRPGRTADYLRLLHAVVLPGLAATDGMMAAEVLGPLDADGEEESGERVVLITRWRDQAALAAAAGTGWRAAPVDRPDELELQARPAHVWHFAPA